MLPPAQQAAALAHRRAALVHDSELLLRRMRHPLTAGGAPGGSTRPEQCDSGATPTSLPSCSVTRAGSLTRAGSAGGSRCSQRSGSGAGESSNLTASPSPTGSLVGPQMALPRAVSQVVTDAAPEQMQELLQVGITEGRVWGCGVG